MLTLAAGLCLGCARGASEGGPAAAGTVIPEPAMARLASAAEFVLDGDSARVAAVCAAAAPLGWRCEEVAEPQLKPGQGWTVYAPLSDGRTTRLLPPSEGEADVRRLIAAIAPKLGFGMHVTAYDAAGQEIGPP